MAFTLEVANVFRDFSQGLYGNRIPLDDDDVIEIIKLWDQLVQESLKNPNAPIKFGPFEVGGADPQVTAEFRNEDFMETYRKLRKHARYTALRPLFRAANTFLLEPAHEKDLIHIVTQLAEDVANKKVAPELVKELLRLKIFDSQGITKEVEAAVNAVARLHKEYGITAEIAIPYSKGEVYPDALYVKKIEEAFNLLVKSGIPLNECRISLKDMGGQLDPEAAKTLLPKIIQKLKDLQKNLKEQTGRDEIIPIGLHLHDTGFGNASYLEAIRICKDKGVDYPLVIDTVECDPYKPEYVGEQSYRNTGFASLLNINEACKREKIDLGLTEGQIEKLKKMSALGKKVAEKYSARRVEALFEGHELRQFDIPGGAFASFVTAVSNMLDDKKMGLAKILDLSERDALLVAGHALNVVGKLMGYPFAVTPGFQNKQIAALNVLQNMIEAKIIKPGMSVETIKALLEEKATTDEGVEKYFLKGLKKAVEDFLQGEMPAETLEKLNIKTNARVHPKIREKFKIRPQVLTATAKSKLDDAQKIVDELYEEGFIKPTATQEEVVRAEYIGLLETDIQKILMKKAKQTHVTWALELGDPKRLREALKKRWWREPNPAHYQGDKQGYLWALERSQRGKNPLPDEVERRYMQLKQGKLSLETLDTYVKMLLKKERSEIWVSILNYMKNHPQEITAVLSGDEVAYKAVFEKIYAQQEKIIRDKEFKGEYFLFPKKRRLDIALDYFNKSIKPMNFRALGKATRKEIEGKTLVSMQAGKILDICVKEGEYVKKDQTVGYIFAMKMEIPLVANKDGYVEKMLVKPGDIVTAGHPLIVYKEAVTDKMDLEKGNGSSSHSVPGNLDPIRREIITLNSSQQILREEIDALQKKMDYEVTHAKPNNKNDNNLMTRLKKQGFYGKLLSLTDKAKQNHENVIDVIGNRSVAATKIYADLKQAGHHVRLLYTKEDQYSPLIKHAEPGEAILIDSYTSYKIVINALIKIARANPDKRIRFHPGWGMLSEDYRFVKLLEETAKGLGLNIEFVGPPSDAMEEIGGKLSFRHSVHGVEKSRHCNPKYFGNHSYKAAELNDYINGGFSQTHPLHSVCTNEFNQIKEIGGNVMLKAIDGGGGYGIEKFSLNDKGDQDNYQRYVQLLHKNASYSERMFNNGKMLTEQCIEGRTRHLEVQFAANAMGSIVLHVRDCTAQNKNQKTRETNAMQGDYSDELTLPMLQAVKAAVDEFALKKNYKGVGTLEMIVSDNKVYFLEVNTRLQVEHPVTECDFEAKTETIISVPLINDIFSDPNNQQETPHQLLKDNFPVTDGDLMKGLAFGNQRIEHIRLNSLEIDLLTGKSVASYFWGYMWPGSDIIAMIQEKTGATIIITDIGDGNYNAQTGAIYGTKEQVDAAAEEIKNLVELARCCTHGDGTISIDFVIEMSKLMYNNQGNFNPNFDTKSQDDFLKAIAKEEIEVEVDMQSLSMTPAPIPGATEKAFNQFLSCRAQEAAIHENGITGHKRAFEMT